MGHPIHHVMRRLAFTGWLLNPAGSLTAPVCPYLQVELDTGSVFAERSHPARFAPPWRAPVDGTVLLRVVIRF